MGWFKVDDHYFTHPKVWEAGEAAALLNLQGIAYCSANQTDGRIPHGMVSRLTENPQVPELIERLLEAGLWKKTSKHYIIHDYLEHQSSRAQIRNRKAKNAGRQKEYRERNAVTESSRNAEVCAPEAETDTDTDAEPEADIYRITPRETTSLTAPTPTAVEIQRTPAEVKAAIEEAGLNPTKAA